MLARREGRGALRSIQGISMRSSLIHGLAIGALASGLMLAAPAFASHATNDGSAVSTTAPGATASYRMEFTSCCMGTYVVANPGEGSITVSFPAGYDLSAASFNAAASGIRANPGASYTAFPAHAVSVDANARTITISAIDATITQDQTGFRIVLAGVRNPSSAGNQYISVVSSSPSAGAYSVTGFNFPIFAPPGVDLDVPTDAARYASEIIATSAAPVTLANNAGVLNLNVPLRYNPSHDEVRYARVECPGLRFANNTTVSYTGGGTAVVGAVNGLNSSAIYFSVTAHDDVTASDRFVIGGDRLLTGTQPVACTYGLYDEPSQAAQGTSAGRIATLTGAYLDFAPSTVFKSVARTSTANVEATPAYTAFLADGTTTTTTAALARLTYQVASPTPLKASGTPITLADLHATGAAGTRIVVSGDFTGAADANGSYTSGTALARVFLSTTSTGCTFGTPASSVSATGATFVVGATAVDRMLCYTPRAGVAVAESVYTAVLDAVSAAPTVYRVDDIGPVAAGAIVRNGTQLQAPMINLPQGYVSRVALTNTGATARRYVLQVLPYEGSPATVNGAALTGMVPGNGGTVIELKDVITAFGGAGATRAVVLVTVEGSNAQIQGQYQIVRPDTGAISNYVMVRPGSN
jgi:hypothetical protein